MLISVVVVFLALTILGIAGLTYLIVHRTPLNHNTSKCNTFPFLNKDFTLREFNGTSSMRQPDMEANTVSYSTYATVDLEQGHSTLQFIVTPPTPIKREIISKRDLWKKHNYTNFSIAVLYLTVWMRKRDLVCDSVHRHYYKKLCLKFEYYAMPVLLRIWFLISLCIREESVSLTWRITAAHSSKQSMQRVHVRTKNYGIVVRVMELSQLSPKTRFFQGHHGRALRSHEVTRPAAATSSFPFRVSGLCPGCYKPTLEAIGASPTAIPFLLFWSNLCSLNTLRSLQRESFHYSTTTFPSFTLS